MKRQVTCSAALTTVVALAFSPAAASVMQRADSGLPLREIARLALPGPSNRFDYQSIDSGAGRLYISHMDGDRLLVFDVRRRKVVKSFNVPGVHGVIVVPQLGRVFASVTNVQQVVTIDTRKERILGYAQAGEYPDGLAYDPVEQRVFVSDEAGGAEIVLDARGRRIGRIDLGGDAGNVQYDARSGHILVDVQTSNVVAVIDPRTNKIVKRIPVPGCESDHGLLVDSPRRLAFIACDENAMLFTLDLANMRITGSATVGQAPDVLAFDPSLRRLYVAAESGVVAVFQETSQGLRKLGQALLAPHAHTVAVDPATHLVYFPLEATSSGKPQLLIMAPTP
jgi:DNA-binding beta-propeller fold protein YncE